MKIPTFLCNCLKFFWNFSGFDIVCNLHSLFPSFEIFSRNIKKISKSSNKPKTNKIKPSFQESCEQQLDTWEEPQTNQSIQNCTISKTNPWSILTNNFFRGDHVEVLEIDYDPEVITYKELLDIFWNNHEYGLSTKVKRQYQSFIFYHTEEQKRLSEISKAEEEIKRNPEIITTEITEAVKFYPAEELVFDKIFYLKNKIF